MSSLAINNTSGFYEIAKYLKGLSEQQLQAFFDSPQMDDIQFLSSRDTDLNLPMAHIFKDCERFVMSPAAQRPDVLAIKDAKGYPLSFRILSGTSPRTLIKDINKGEAFIRELSDNNDHRVALLQNGAFKGELRRSFIENPSRLWLLTDAAKDLRIIDASFECQKDPYVWKFFGEDTANERVTLKPIMAVLSEAVRTMPCVREYINLVYHNAPGIIRLLDEYADMDVFSNPTHGFGSSSPGRYAYNGQSLLLLAEHYHRVSGTAISEVPGFDLATFTDTPHYGPAFKDQFIHYALSFLNNHTDRVKALAAGVVLPPNEIQHGIDELSALSKNVLFFESSVNTDQSHYADLSWLADVAKTTQESIAFLLEQYQRHLNAILFDAHEYVQRTRSM